MGCHGALPRARHARRSCMGSMAWDRGSRPWLSPWLSAGRSDGQPRTRSHPDRRGHLRPCAVLDPVQSAQVDRRDREAGVVEEGANRLHRLAHLATKLGRGAAPDVKPGPRQTRRHQVAPEPRGELPLLMPHGPAAPCQRDSSGAIVARPLPEARRHTRFASDDRGGGRPRPLPRQDDSILPMLVRLGRNVYEFASLDDPDPEVLRVAVPVRIARDRPDHAQIVGRRREGIAQGCPRDHELLGA